MLMLSVCLSISLSLLSLSISLSRSNPLLKFEVKIKPENTSLHGDLHKDT